MKIGIISDTHGVLKDTLLAQLQDCDYIIHAGDIGSLKCYQALKDLKIPMYMVRGNCDKGSWAAYLPEKLAFSIQGHLFYLVHDRFDVPYGVEYEYLIFGHTHKYEMGKIRGGIYLNPGSASEPRGGGGASMVVMYLTESGGRVEKVLL